MQDLNFTITNQSIFTDYDSPLYSGTSIYTCNFSFQDPIWEEYLPNVSFLIEDLPCAFENFANPQTAPIVDGKCKIPVQLLIPGTKLKIGVFGIKGEDTLSTIYSDAILVRRGASKGQDVEQLDADLYDRLMNYVDETNLPEGGEPGQVLTKNTSEDYDADWKDIGDFTDKTFEYVQLTPESVWEINHNLNKHPSVVVVDSADTVVIGDITYIDENNVRIVFTGKFSGKAYLN